MRKAWRGWRDLPFEKQLAIVVAPLLIAVVAGVLVPAINRALEPDDPPKVSGARLSNIHVERHVTLEEFIARQQTAGDPTATRDERREGEVRAVAVLTQLTDQDGDGVEDGQDACPDQAGTSNGCPTGADQDGDGVEDGQDACPDQAGTSNGCPPGGDQDGDGVEDGQDACPDQAGIANGCPAARDRDGDRVFDDEDSCPGQKGATTTGCPQNDDDGDSVTNPTDNCPDEPNLDQNDSDGDGLGDACELPPLIRRIRIITPECPTDELRKALDGDDDACPAVNALIGPIGTQDAADKAQAVLAALRRTKRAAGSGGQRQVIGVMVSFDVELNGAPGNQADVRWSLYRTKGRGRVPYPWLIRHRVSEIEGQAESDTGSGDFWVPLPKLRGPFKVRIEVFRDKDSRLTFRETDPFS